jgi:hypothetical protein
MHHPKALNHKKQEQQRSKSLWPAYLNLRKLQSPATSSNPVKPTPRTQIQILSSIVS